MESLNPISVYLKKSLQKSVATMNAESSTLKKDNQHQKVLKEIKEQFTAAFMTINVYNKTICTLADSGASDSAIAFT